MSITHHHHADEDRHEHGHGHGHHDHGHAGHAHGHAPVATASNRQRVLLSAVLTLGFMLAEAVGGLLTGSLALLADAGHMLTDSVALVLAYIAYRMSDRPGTNQMTYGFDRLKILVAYTNGLTILVIAFWIVVEAVKRVMSPEVVLGGPMLGIAVAGLLINVVVLLVLSGGDRTSLNLRGAMLHALGDLLGSAAAIAAAIIILLTGWFPADPLLSVLVALLLVGSAWRLIRESGLILLEAAPAEIDRNAVASDLQQIAGVRDVHHMHIWTLDGRQLMATLHARVSDKAEAEHTIAAIKARLAGQHGIHHATVEVETGEACPDDGPDDELERRHDGTARR